ncbi:MAG: copper(I)-binding protein [Rhodoferax sp.]|jgi:copper(I)-binding protein
MKIISVEAVTLISASTAVANTNEIHEMRMDGNRP